MLAKLNFETTSNGIRLLLMTTLAVISFSLAGCETTDYEPLILKKKLRDLEEKIEQGAGGIPADLEERMKSLEDSVDDLKKTNEELLKKLSAKAAEEEGEIVALLEKQGAYLAMDEAGSVTQVDFAEVKHTNEQLKPLADLGSLKHVILNGLSVDSETFEILSELSEVERLDLDRSKPTSADFEALKKMPNLKFLQLFRATLDDADFEIVAQFPALEQIRCGQTRVGDDGIAHLKNLKTLRAIDLSDCNRVTNSGLESLSNCPNLSFVKVWGPAIDDAGMEFVGKMKSLKVLGLNDTTVTDAGIQKLKSLEKLSEIHLFRTAVGDEGVKVLAQMPNMVTLNLRDTKVSDTGVGYLTGLKKLRRLDLSETNSPGVTAASGEHFATMQSLQDLNLWSTNFDDSGVDGIVELRNLTRLNLDKTQITDVGVKKLESIPQLQWLHVGSNSLTDESVSSLCKLKKLGYLNVTFTEISSQSLYKLEDSLSEDCEIVGP